MTIVINEQPPMTKIIYPTLDLFIYDLRSGAGETIEEIQGNREIFQRKLPESVRPNLFQFDNTFEVEYLELLAKPKNKRFEDNREGCPVEGYYYPVRLGDTYGLLVDCSVNDRTNPQLPESLAFLKAEIEEKRLNKQTATIGQSWMISAQVPNADPAEIENIAKDCYQALMPDLNWERDLVGRGYFLEGFIFELSRYRLKITEDTTSIASIDNIQENQHVIIVLYPDETAAREAAKYYSDWMRLFYYRHKILWCYGQSRVLKQSLKRHLVTIQNSIKFVKSNDRKGLQLKEISQQLEQVQSTLSPYSIELTYLDFQIRSIDINLSNYKKRWETISAKAGEAAEISFLQQFSELAEDKYLLQINKDYDNLKLGLSLLDSSINTLRSRVEVEEAKRDRTFQNAVAIIGIGFSATSLLDSLPQNGAGYSDPVRYLLVNYLQIPSPWLNAATGFVYELAVAFVAGGLTWLVIQFWPKSD